MKNAANKAKFNCSCCGAALDVHEGDEYTTCRFCGTKYSVSKLIEESDAVRIQKIKSNAFKEVEVKKIHLMELQEKNRTLEIRNNAVRKFLSYLIPAMFCLAAPFVFMLIFFSFSEGYLFSGITTTLQLTTIVLSILMGFHILKPKKKKTYIVCVIVSFLLVMPWMGFTSMEPQFPGRKIQWDDYYLSLMLPEPPAERAELYSDSPEQFQIAIYKIKPAQMRDYIESCKDAGFSQEAKLNDNEFIAFNQDGYRLEITMYKTMRINLDAPIQQNKIFWDQGSAITYLPVPPVLTGEECWNYEYNYQVQLRPVTRAQYEAYVEEVYACGFNTDYEKSENEYEGRNQDKLTAYIEFNGYDTMTVQLSD